MGALKNAIVGASFASLALAHTRHMKRATLPFDGTIWTSCVTKGTIALTFDDGPYIYTQSVVDQLTAAGHKVTFFQNGQNYDSIFNYNATLQSMIAGGHQIGSHTWSHADLTTLTVDGINQQMQELEAAHLAIIGKAPTYMRPPYLATNDLVISTLKTLQYIIVEVDIDTQDWAEGPIGEINLSIQWYEGNQTAGGSLSLNHDVYQPTADTFVPAIIAYLKTKGLTSVTAGECLGDDPANWYRGGAVSVPPPSSPAPSSSPTGGASAQPSASSKSAGSSSPTGSVSGSPTGSSSSGGPGKPVSGGDTEPGHGANAGRGALPGHSGQGNEPVSGWSANGTGSGSTSGYGSSSGSGSGSTTYTSGNGSAVSPHPSYYSNSASGVTGNAVIIGAAAIALLL